MDKAFTGAIWGGGFSEYPMHKGIIKTDVLVIGGGIAGILTAKLLEESGVSCVVAEAGRVCGGVTKNTTAKITPQHGLIYTKILKNYGAERAKMYLAANAAGARLFEERARGFDCGYEKRDSFVYSRNAPEKLSDELSALEKIGAGELWGFDLVGELPLPFVNFGAIRFRNAAQLEPLKFLAKMAEGLEIYENTRILDVEGNTALSAAGRFIAKKIVFATHFPFLDRRGGYFIKMYQSRSYVMALENAAFPDGMYIDENERGFTFRKSGNLLLMAGGAHKTGEKPRLDLVLRAGERFFPEAKRTALWAAQDCMTLDGIPYAGVYSKRTPDWYVITGFNKWGMTNAFACAEIIRDKILGRENDFGEVYSPARRFFGRQLFINGVNSVKNLATLRKPRCPHLGCALKYNGAENSWDCPCHGSRFSENGALQNGPANTGLCLHLTEGEKNDIIS